MRDGWSVEVPSHRIDIGLEEDLLDEIARQHGFDKFPPLFRRQATVRVFLLKPKNAL